MSSSEIPKVNIDKAWDTLHSQSVSADNGDTWLITEIIDQAKDLPIFDLPLYHLSISNKRIADTDIREFVAHMKMILEADLSVPIILDEDGAIFDGRHRVAKALLEGKTTIKAKRFDNDPPPSYNRKNGK